MEVRAQMGGTVWKLLVQVGDTVQEGQDIAIIESMKMEIPINAEATGTVVEILAEEAQFVQEDEVLMIIKEE
jgi:acetyl-CoA carboxylase biotin carboxyl carrier protein